jgi:hypothetical protein
LITSQRSLLLNEMKTGTILYFEQQLGENDLRATRLRVYVQRSNWYEFWKKQKKVNLVKKHIEGLSTPENVNGLTFDVTPELQGLVAQCYAEKKIMYEEDLSLAFNEYNLNTYQKSAYADIRFWLCSPIINHKGKVVAVISFESIHCINIGENVNQVGIIMTNFSKNLYGNCSELFR